MSENLAGARRIARALAVGMVAGLVAAAEAQETGMTFQCQYVAGESDPLGPLPGAKVTARFDVPVVAVATDNRQTKLTKGTGPSFLEFLPKDFIQKDSVMAVEVDAKLSTAQGQSLLCVNSARVRGVGFFNVNDGGPAVWLIRDHSILDAARRLGTAECNFNAGVCSFHRVKAALRITAQGARNNGSAQYARFIGDQDEIFGTYVGEPPRKGQGLFLVCGCVQVLQESNAAGFGAASRHTPSPSPRPAW